MCVAIPGKILKITGAEALVDFRGNQITVNIGLVDAKEEDYVLVHAGCALEVLKKERAVELLELLKDLEALYDETAR